MPRKTAGRIVPRKSPSKDSNGGKLGQFTTEVKETIEKARLQGMEEQKNISAAFFLKKIQELRTDYDLKIKWINEEKSHFKGWAIFAIGIVIGSALMAVALGV